MQIPFLNLGDSIAVVATSFVTNKVQVQKSIDLLSEKFNVIVGDHVYNQYHTFAGDDIQRKNDVQKFLNDKNIKAILFARGGYGSVRIIDNIDFSMFKKFPKWLVGYSDITVFHAHVHQWNIPTLHAPMLQNDDATIENRIKNITNFLTGKIAPLRIGKVSKWNKDGNVTAPIVGGNLTVLCSLLQSKSFPNCKNKILFIEDVGEALYSIDRMLLCLKRSGHLKQLSGLLVGDFTNIPSTQFPFGKTIEEIVYEHTAEYDYPIAMHVKSGHDIINNPIMLGLPHYMQVINKKAIIKPT